MFKMTRNLKQSNHRDRQRRECTGDITHQYNVFEKEKTHTHFSLKYPVIPYIAQETKTVYREIFARFYFHPFRP